jgi:hypothetical protein
MHVYLNTHLALENQRMQAVEDSKDGPRVCVKGAPPTYIKTKGVCAGDYYRPCRVR